MNQVEKTLIIDKYKNWFRDSLIVAHKKNTEKLVNIEEFNINPFLLYYLSNYLEGDSSPKSLARALIYPRVLGTSITTSFGNGMQTFMTDVLGAYGSTTAGIDIEFIDHSDNRRKYCQLKAGPNVVNKDDVTTVSNHFTAVKNLARTNNIKDLQISDMVFCLLYGEPDEKNSFVKKIENDFVVYIGKEFWHKFTGDEGFYKDLIIATEDVAKDVNMKNIVDNVIEELSDKIQKRYDSLKT